MESTSIEDLPEVPSHPLESMDQEAPHFYNDLIKRVEAVEDQLAALKHVESKPDPSPLPPQPLNSFAQFL